MHRLIGLLFALIDRGSAQTQTRPNDRRGSAQTQTRPGFRPNADATLQIRPNADAVADLEELRDESVRRSDAAIAGRDAAIAGRDAAIAERDAAMSERDAAISERESAIAERDAAISERDAAVGERDTAARTGKMQSSARPNDRHELFTGEAVRPRRQSDEEVLSKLLHDKTVQAAQQAAPRQYTAEEMRSRKAVAAAASANLRRAAEMRHMEHIRYRFDRGKTTYLDPPVPPYHHIPAYLYHTMSGG